jgi:signal transduction histidine kinase
VHADSDGLWLGTTTLPKEQGICHIVADLPVDKAELEAPGECVVIPDLSKDEKTANLPFVKDSSCGRFFAGVPILSPKGHHIGTYCVLDDEPREGISSTGVQFMKDMSKTVMSYLELARAREEHRRGERMVRGLGSFHEGKSTLRTWRPVTGGSPGNEDRAYESSRPGRAGGEGQLNQEQQEAQFNQDQQEQLLQDPADTLARLTEGAGNSQNTNAPILKHEGKGGITFALPASSSSGASYSDTQSRSSLSEARSNTTDTFSSGVPSVGTADPETADRLTLQEDMLSMGVKAAFSRASNIIRESIEVEGSIFIDAAIGGFYGGLLDDDDCNNLDSTSSSGLTSSSDSSSKTTSSKASNTSKALKAERMCGVLGFSTSHTSSINNSILPKLQGLIPENLLKGLVKRYPKGKIFHYTEDGQASSGSSSEASYDSNAPLYDPDHEKPLSRARARRKADRRFSRRTDAEEVIKIFPGARSIAITPLWDSHRSRWFSLGLVWTNSPQRVLTVEGDLSYLASFGNTIMAEVARLDALTAEKAKTDLLGSISHELRSPLHGILGSVELLEGSITGPLQANLVNCIETCGRTLLDTIDHLLDYTKINHSSQLARHERSAEKIRRELGAPLKSKKSKEYLAVDLDVDICAVTEEVMTAVSAGYDVHRLAALRTGGPGRNAHPLDSSYADDTSGNPALRATKSSQLDKVAVSIDISSASSWMFTTQAGAWRRIVMNL